LVAISPIGNSSVVLTGWLPLSVPVIVTATNRWKLLSSGIRTAPWPSGTPHRSESLHVASSLGSRHWNHEWLIDTFVGCGSVPTHA
jgi:hypothetical protein